MIMMYKFCKRLGVLESPFCFLFCFLLGSLGTACSDKDYCSPVLCLESEAKNPFPFFSRLLRHAREGLGCMHILCSRAYSGNLQRSLFFLFICARHFTFFALLRANKYHHSTVVPYPRYCHQTGPTGCWIYCIGQTCTLWSVQSVTCNNNTGDGVQSFVTEHFSRMPHRFVRDHIENWRLLVLTLHLDSRNKTAQRYL